MKIGPVHPDAEEALQILLRREPEVGAATNPQLESDNLTDLVLALEELLDELGEGGNDSDRDDSDGELVDN